jgi:putative tricarboxylic transport membrane protein
VLSPFNIAMICLGTIIGLFVGSMPGLSATMALALLLPITFPLPPESGLSMLAALYIAAMYGGSIAAILLKTPGTPAAAATVLDGYPMAARGEAGRALGISLSASLVGGVISGFALLLIAPLLGRIVLQFGPLELFAVAVLGITIIASLSRGSTLKGLFAGALGLLLAMIGMDPMTGTPRFTWGNINLFSGVSFTAALIGLFSIPQAFNLMRQGNGSARLVSNIRDRILPRWAEFRRLLPRMAGSGVIGVLVGLVPGTGGDTASWFAYNESKRFSKTPEEFGKGSPEGLCAPEAANNAVVGGALVPTIALGIPGSSSAAILMGGLMVHGILPGPTLMTQYGDVTYTLIWAVIFTNVALLVFGLAFTRACVFVTMIPNMVIAPIIVVLCVVGSFAINNNMFDVYVMLGFGLLGIFFDRIGVPPAPIVIGLILGSLFDMSLGQSLLIGQGSYLVFFNSPLATIFLILAVLALLQATPFFGWIRRRLTGPGPSGGNPRGTE